MGVDKTKLKMNLNLTRSRLKVQAGQKSAKAMQDKQEIANLLKENKRERARIKVEHIIRYMVKTLLYFNPSVPDMALFFLNCESKCDLKKLSASINNKKIAARPFDTIHDILRSLSLAQYLLKRRKAPIWRIGNQGV